MPVERLRVTLSKTEYYGWVQYYSFKAPEVAEIQMATLISTIINALSKSKTKTEDFIISKTHEGPKNEYEAMGYIPIEMRDEGNYMKPL